MAAVSGALRTAASGGLGTGPAPRGRAGPRLCDARVRCTRWPGARTSRQPGPGLPGLQPHGPRCAPPASRRPQPRATGTAGTARPPAPSPAPVGARLLQTDTHKRTHTHTHTAVPEGQAWSELTIHIRLGKWCIPVIGWKPSPTLQNQLYAQSHDRRLTHPRKL
jgi:hypothetical protein